MTIFFPFLLSLFWGGVSLFSRHHDWPFLVSANHDVLKYYSVNLDWSALCETWTAKILDCLHAQWRSMEENKSLMLPNDLNWHLVAWFNFNFESFDITSHFSVLRPKHVAEIKYTICFATHEMQKYCSWTCDEATFAPLDTVHTFQGQWSMLN